VSEHAWWRRLLGRRPVRGRWEVTATTETADVVHVRPLADLIEHDLDDDCPCGPTAELVPRADESDGWMYTHHSLDGREATE
jgi:hypothetical protein